jgi:hypothetical protein
LLCLSQLIFYFFIKVCSLKLSEAQFAILGILEEAVGVRGVIETETLGLGHVKLGHFWWRHLAGEVDLLLVRLVLSYLWLLLLYVMCLELFIIPLLLLKCHFEGISLILHFQGDYFFREGQRAAGSGALLRALERKVTGGWTGVSRG